MKTIVPSRVTERIVSFFSNINLSIRVKILLAFLTVTLIMVSLNVMFIWRSWQYNRQYDVIIDSITLANNISRDFKPQFDEEMWKVVTEREAFAEGRPYQIINRDKYQLEQMMDNADSQKGQIKLSVILRTLETLREQVDVVGQMIEQGSSADDRANKFYEIEQISTLVQTGLQDYVIFETERSGQQYREIRENFENWIYINIFVMGFVIFLSIAAAWLISESISSPIKKLHDLITATQRELDLQVTSDRADELAELSVAFNVMVDRIGSMTAQLRRLVASLEEQVRERTKELALSMEVGQRATAMRDVNRLLPTITEFIREQFNLYYTHVYLVDDTGENLVMRAGTGEVGQALMARHHTMPIDLNSIVGRTAATGQPVVVPNTDKSEFHKPNPLLPETRSELAVPLIVEGKVIGVLDMQNNKIDTFTPENQTVFEAMAVQLAISIDSAHQWALTQEAQQRAEEAIKQLTREAWAERLAASSKDTGFVYDLSRISALLPDAYALTSTPENGHSIPLVVQDQTIGYLSVKTPGDRDLTEDERALLQAVAQQLAQKAENLRLFEATQQRASREQIARRIIDRVRASRNIEMALRTAAEELSKALGTARATVDLQIVSQPQPIPTEEQYKENQL